MPTASTSHARALTERPAADTPGWSVEWYRNITEFAQQTPSWAHTVAEIATEALLLVFAALFLGAWWRARRGPARGMAVALLAPCVTVAAYVVSEALKGFLEERRPCRVVSEAVAIAGCPPVGDWSFPSNHATIAAASTTAVIIAWRLSALIAVPTTVLMAFSRVFVGVHYPHDVIGGLVLGATVAALLVLGLVPLVTPLVERLRGHHLVGALLTDTVPVRSSSKGRRRVGRHSE